MLRIIAARPTLECQKEHDVGDAAITSRKAVLVRVLAPLIFGLCFASATPVYADTVTPTADVLTRVVVRASASSQSAAIGSLRPGEDLELVGSVPYWHEVRLPNGSTGFVSKRWTRVISAGVPPAGPPPTTAPTFTIDVVDVGTGLAVLVRGSDFALVYDAGSNDDLARGANNRMLAFTQAAAPTLTTIDHMILSPHRDHVELLPDLLANYSVRHVWDSGRINDICSYRAFLTAVRDEPGVQYHNALQDFGTRDYAFGAKASGCYGQAAPAVALTLSHSSRINSEDPIPLGQDASMRILHADGANHPNPNENTLVVRLDLGATRVLLMGDAPGGPRANPSSPPTVGSIEQVLVTCCSSALAAQILVVGHHGSMTSSRAAFLNAIGSSIAVLSSGPTQYGPVTLPDPSIVTELQSRGQVFRTDVNDGACGQNPDKIGPDADGRAGGCTNIRIVLTDPLPPQVSVWSGS
jgi:beta-lactamase superfamily II metal-dependent hydrolase